MGSSKRSEKEAFWRLALEEFEGSGLSVRSYCLREGLSEPSFYAWRKTIRDRDSAGLDAAVDKQTLVPVALVTSDDVAPRRQEPLSTLEVIAPNGFTLRFREDLQLQRLGALLGVIAQSDEAAPC